MKKYWQTGLIVPLLTPITAMGYHNKPIDNISAAYFRRRSRLKSLRERHEIIEQKLKDQKQGRIVGGTPVEEGEFPFFAFPFGVMLCGATIVHVDVLLTAAHCAGVFLEGALIGGTNINGDGSTYYPTALELPHPDYNSMSDENDLMLVKLSRPTEVTPVQLNFDSNVPVVDEQVTVIGFGNTEQDGKFSQVLLQTNVDVFPFEACQDYFGGLNNNTIICAGTEEGGRDSCQGDSGGPLLTSTNVQVGIVSFGDGCGGPGVPAVYTRISGYQTWIRSSICDISAVPPSYCDTISPTNNPTLQATNLPTESPTVPILAVPSSTPVVLPTIGPSFSTSTTRPTQTPSLSTTPRPLPVPTMMPTVIPTLQSSSLLPTPAIGKTPSPTFRTTAIVSPTIGPSSFPTPPHSPKKNKSAKGGKASKSKSPKASKSKGNKSPKSGKSSIQTASTRIT